MTLPTPLPPSVTLEKTKFSGSLSITKRQKYFEPETLKNVGDNSQATPQ